MPDTGYFHLHLVSDATGETLITVARAAAAQYANVSPVEHLYPMVRSKKQLDHVLAEIAEAPGLVLYTLLEEDLIQTLESKCRELGLPCMSVLGPILRLFQSYLGAETIHRAGAQHVLNAEYFQRIDALNYSMMHDDGQHPEGLEDADVVLVGVSRTSKTPTSIYLANRGVKTGNVPLVPGVPLAPQVEKLTHPLVVGPVCEPRAHRADPREPAAGPARAPRRRPIYRQEGGGGGGGVFAPAVRQAQLAVDRRDAPLDRGDRRRGDAAVDRARRQPATECRQARARE